MKKILAIVLAVVILTTLTLSVVAVKGLPSYDGDYYAGPVMNRGEINANKHNLIQFGKAGDPAYDDVKFVIPGVRGTAVPTIDGKVSAGEGYKDFANFADYLYVLANIDGYGSIEFNDWYNEAKAMDITVKSCWDGKYIYFYFEYEVESYICNTNNALDLWKWHCMQFGLADQDAMAYDFSETIYGVNSNSKNSVSGATHGSYIPVANEDYKGIIASGSDYAKTKVAHEFRVDICRALEKTEAAEEYDVVKLCWVLMANNRGSSVGQKGLSFGHGITGRESAKFAQHFVNVILGDGVDETVDNAASGKSATISVSDASAMIGNTVKVAVNIDNNPGLSSLKFKVVYDEALTLTDVQLSSELGANVTAPTPFANPQTINIVSPLKEITYNGTIATLTFEVADNVADGYVADVKIEYVADDVFNEDFENVALTVENGSVTAFASLPGDIDGDGFITNKDAVILLRYTSGTSVDVEADALDITGDGRVDNRDVITLFRYVAGWKGVVLYRGSK